MKNRTKRTCKEISSAVLAAITEIEERLKKDKPNKNKYLKKIKSLDQEIVKRKRSLGRRKGNDSAVTELKRKIQELKLQEEDRRTIVFNEILTSLEKKYGVSAQLLRTISKRNEQGKAPPG